jgi:acylphosphatase
MMLYINDDLREGVVQGRGNHNNRYQATQTAGAGVEETNPDKIISGEQKGRITTYQELQTIAVRVSGKVQRVGMRNCIRSIAGRLNIKGEVMNLPDGTVLAIATGDPILLEKFVSMIYGCPRAVIRDLEITEYELTHFEEFLVKRIDL